MDYFYKKVLWNNGGREWGLHQNLYQDAQKCKNKILVSKSVIFISIRKSIPAYKSHTLSIIQKK